MGYADRFDAGVPSQGEDHFAGSIMHLDLNMRKRILYNLIEVEPNFIEICYGAVITSDGRSVPAEKYFKEGGREVDNKRYAGGGRSANAHHVLTLTLNPRAGTTSTGTRPRRRTSSWRRRAPSRSTSSTPSRWTIRGRRGWW